MSLCPECTLQSTRTLKHNDPIFPLPFLRKRLLCLQSSKDAPFHSGQIHWNDVKVDRVLRPSAMQVESFDEVAAFLIEHGVEKSLLPVLCVVTRLWKVFLFVLLCS